MFFYLIDLSCCDHTLYDMFFYLTDLPCCVEQSHEVYNGIVRSLHIIVGGNIYTTLVVSSFLQAHCSLLGRRHSNNNDILLLNKYYNIY